MAEVVDLSAERLRKAFLDRYEKPSTEATDDELLEFLEQKYGQDADDGEFFGALYILTGERS